MTPEEQDKILNVIAIADGGCSNCVSGLLDALGKVFPDVPWRKSFGPFSYDTINKRGGVVNKLMWPDAYDDEDEAGDS
ncbi:MAG TPA: hypothetical protein VFB89_06260 [Gemmatimonadales bacterium]|nr:hypothetical protein [Gemmatimonadales bacterium]